MPRRKRKHMDRDPRLPSREAMTTADGRMLDPSGALGVEGVTVRTTAYVATRLTISRTTEIPSAEPGFAEETRPIGVTGICGSGIIEALAEMFLAGILTQDGVIDGAMAARSRRIQPDGRTYSYLLHQGEPVLRITPRF